MSRELEALYNLYARASVHCPIDEISIILDELHIIKNVLKALEIIKAKNVNIGLIKDKDCTLEIYNTMMLLKQWQLTQKEYNLLKGILL